MGLATDLQIKKDFSFAAGRVPTFRDAQILKQLV